MITEHGCYLDDFYNCMLLFWFRNPCCPAVHFSNLSFWLYLINSKKFQKDKKQLWSEMAYSIEVAKFVFLKSE